MEPVLKRHPRLAVWRVRAGEFGPPMACLAVGVKQLLMSRSFSGVYWIVGALTLLAYEWRLWHAWTWGWEAGRQAALARIGPLITSPEDSPEEFRALREAYLADPPTWLETQDRIARIDHEATIQATLEGLRRAPRDEASA